MIRPCEFGGRQIGIRKRLLLNRFVRYRISLVKKLYVTYEVPDNEFLIKLVWRNHSCSKAQLVARWTLPSVCSRYEQFWAYSSNCGERWLEDWERLCRTSKSHHLRGEDITGPIRTIA